MEMILKQSEIKKILIINLAFIGDILLSTPLTRAVKENYPEAEIVMLVTPNTVPMAEMNPYVNNVIPYDKKDKHKGLFGAIDIVKVLRKEKFDMAICTNFAVRGAMIAMAASIKYRVGYDAQHASCFLTHVTSAKRDKIQHETMNQLIVLASIGITTEDTSLILTIDPQIDAMMNLKWNLSKDKPWVVICPFGRYRKRNFSNEKYATVMNKIREDVDLFLIGGANDQEDLFRIAEQAGLSEEKVLAGRLSLKELAVFISYADVLLTVDTGPLHIAQAVSTPVVALFGPSDPLVWGPRKSEDVVIHLRKECSPCWKKTECIDNICMNEMDLDLIAAKVLAVIKSKS